MVTELQELMRQNVAAPPPDDLDLRAIVGAGQRRVRLRRGAGVGAVALATAAAVTTVVVLLPGGSDQVAPADHPPAPDAPTLHLAAATQGVEGRDYRVLTSYTNDNLDRDNGRYFDGVTEDGLVLFRDGPRLGQLWSRFALLDPATGDKDWLPSSGVGKSQTWPVSLDADRLVLLSTEANGTDTGALVAHVFDRSTREWSDVSWPDLPAADPYHVAVGPDDRLYVSTAATQGGPPPGGWPTGPDGEAEDADAAGDTYELWSASLSDPADVRDEGLTVGSIAFTDTSLVWTDSTNGEAGRVHVRDLASGAEHAFDPQTGERCNVLGFGASGDRIVMSEYCGTYADGVRDDRVQILSTDGDQVVTVQDTALEGALSGTDGHSSTVVLTSYYGDHAGSYVYDLATDRLLQLSGAVGKFGTGGPAPAGRFLWSTPVNHRHGATQWLGELVR